MRMLLTNDDSISAPGLAALCEAAAPFGEVYVVAPSKVRSACSHAVTFHRPLEAWPEPVLASDGRELAAGTALSGMPADCVKVGLARLVPRPVDLVLSGINAGCNVGVHTLYSGTVSAAREAAIAGVPAVSFSLFLRSRLDIRWSRAAALAGECLAAIVSAPPPAGTFLNVNIPILDDGVEPRGLRVCPASLAPMVDDYRGEPADDGRLALTVGRHVAFREVLPETDAALLFDGWITVTPMQFDQTDHGAMSTWRSRLDRA